ncbi:MAG: 2-dehydropantoate 2-reductase [Candidatus Omnitrophica bacterium]|nr:2-dehydropantoate 2-reductase [Candidatus Omnitrophota bacterium]MDD5352519.1 2-dehydropantoate 2-reductase [Candidatus Omnitrophota bacterium]MDD5550117.1 2-dehydropantoate 2-reductase [Candidatus Omnitrophota bacterium]
MNIAIVGPGAIGILFTTMLSKAGQNVCLLDHDKQRVDFISKNGITVDSKDKTYNYQVKITDKAGDLQDIDLFIICVKSYDTKDAAMSIKPVLKDSSLVLTLQNGLGNIEIISEILGQERVIGGVTNQGANVISHGKIRHAGFGDTVIGKTDSKIPAYLRDIREVFNKAGIPTRISKDIRALIWSKLIINVGINALTAITHLKNGQLLEYEGTRNILCQAVSEAMKIVKRKRIKLIYDDAIEKTEAVCEATAQNISSMLQDVLKKRKTEIDYINGAIVKQGQSLGIHTPVNSILMDLVKSIEASYNKTVCDKEG